MRFGGSNIIGPVAGPTFTVNVALRAEGASVTALTSAATTAISPRCTIAITAPARERFFLGWPSTSTRVPESVPGEPRLYAVS